MKFTCKGCEKREPGCHDHCEKYQKEKADYEARKEQINKDASIKQGVYDQHFHAMAKAQRRHGRKVRDNRG